MSYYRKPVFDRTPGTAYEAFDPGRASPMIPQAMYRPAAAGPRHLTGLGGHVYMNQLRSRRIALRGLGADPIDALTQVFQPGIQQGATIVLEAMWPTLQAKLAKQFQPMQIMLGVTTVAAAAGAVFAFLSWNKRSTSIA